jgi:hypothetical protein
LVGESLQLRTSQLPERMQKQTKKEETMDSEIKEIAAVLHSTETMAAQFVKRVQERVGQPVPHAEILATMKKMSAKTLSMAKVVAKLRQQKR